MSIITICVKYFSVKLAAIVGILAVISACTSSEKESAGQDVQPANIAPEDLPDSPQFMDQLVLGKNTYEYPSDLAILLRNNAELSILFGFSMEVGVQFCEVDEVSEVKVLNDVVALLQFHYQFDFGNTCRVYVGDAGYLSNICLIYNSNYAKLYSDNSSGDSYLETYSAELTNPQDMLLDSARHLYIKQNIRYKTEVNNSTYEDRQNTRIDTLRYDRDSDVYYNAVCHLRQDSVFQFYGAAAQLPDSLLTDWNGARLQTAAALRFHEQNYVYSNREWRFLNTSMPDSLIRIECL